MINDATGVARITVKTGETKESKSFESADGTAKSTPKRTPAANPAASDPIDFKRVRYSSLVLKSEKKSRKTDAGVGRIKGTPTRHAANAHSPIQNAREKKSHGVGQVVPGDGTNDEPLLKSLSYAERKEQQKRRNRAEKAVKDSEAKIEKMEQRLKELDELLMQPENASDMVLVTEYTSTKSALDEEVERWEKLSEQLEELQ